MVDPVNALGTNAAFAAGLEARLYGSKMAAATVPVLTSARFQTLAEIVIAGGWRRERLGKTN